MSCSMGAEPEAIGRNVETERSARGGQLETERLARRIEYSFFNWNSNRKMGRTHRGHESPARPGPFQAPRALAAPEGGIQEPSLCVYACVCMFVCVCVCAFLMRSRMSVLVRVRSAGG